MTNFNPEKWLETSVRGIKDYVTANLNTRIYEVVMEFPGPAIDAAKVPIRKTIIHFEIDAIEDSVLGFDDDPLVWNYSDTDQGVFPQWAGRHLINFDVGIWSSDDSGGTTSRMRAKQELQRLFGFASGISALKDATDGGDGMVELTNYTGGSFTEEKVGDIRVYRMVGGQLEIRVFSRTPMPTEAAPAIEAITQAPNLTILG